LPTFFVLEKAPGHDLVYLCFYELVDEFEVTLQIPLASANCSDDINDLNCQFRFCRTFPKKSETYVDQLEHDVLGRAVEAVWRRLPKGL
jgi:hypothetical protein